MCDEARSIPYDCDQVATKLRPVIGEAQRLFVRSVATGTVFEVVGVETRQAQERRPSGAAFVEDVYLLVRRAPLLVGDEGAAQWEEEATRQ